MNNKSSVEPYYLNRSVVLNRCLDYYGEIIPKGAVGVIVGYTEVLRQPVLLLYGRFHITCDWEWFR